MDEAIKNLLPALRKIGSFWIQHESIAASSREELKKLFIDLKEALTEYRVMAGFSRLITLPIDQLIAKINSCISDISEMLEGGELCKEKLNVLLQNLQNPLNAVICEFEKGSYVPTEEVWINLYKAWESIQGFSGTDK